MSSGRSRPPWKLTASLRPESSAAAGSRTKLSCTASLHTEVPGATVTLSLPAKVTGALVPLTRAGPPICRPTKTPSKVTGLVPNTLVRRSRACRPQMSGRTMSRKVWSLAPAAGAGKAKR
jgi:hypothetical protein